MKSPWPTKKLEEIAEIYSGGKHGITKSEYVEFGFPAYSAAGQDGFTKKAYDRGFAVILSSIGSRCGKCFYAEGEWTALANTQVIKLNNPITARFLYYYLNDEKKWPKSGTGQPFISPRTVKNFLVPLPPLPIQQKIVKILDTIQEAIGVQDRIIELTKELKKSVMADLFKYGAPSFRKGRKLKKTEIGEIPEDWEVVKLGDKNIVEIIMGQSPSSQFYNENKEGLPFLQGKAEFGEIYPIPIKWCSKPIKIAEKGDILISVRAPVGDINLSDQKYCIGRGLAALRCKENLNSMLLFYYLQTKKEKLVNEGTGSTFKAIKKEHLENLKIPLPLLPEQQEIAEILQTIDQKIEIEKKKKALYEELFRTMLNKLMNGEIDVENLDLN